MTPSEVTKKWQRNLVASIPQIKEKVQQLSENPMQKAASKEQEYLAGIQRAVEEGRWKRGLMSASFDDWKRKLITEGTARISGGAQAATQKMDQFFGELLPHAQSVKEAISRMPKGGVENGIARATAAIRMMAQFRKRG